MYKGLIEMVECLDGCDPNVTLAIAGDVNNTFYNDVLLPMLQERPVKILGFLDRAQVSNVYADSFAGLVVLHPIENYLDALPVKMFEYMAAGLPVCV